MQAGRLRNRITIQQRATTQDSAGEPSNTWTTFATVWASVEPIRGREFFEAQKTSSSVTNRIIIRYSSTVASVAPKMRVNFGSKYYDIEAVLNLEERDKEIHLMCAEVV